MGWRGFGCVHHSRTVFCRAVPNLNITIRNFFIAVRLTCSRTATVVCVVASVHYKPIAELIDQLNR
jgi:hypothetical protein